MSTAIDQMRVLIPDTEAVFDGETLFSDTDLQLYLDVSGNNTLRAAGYAIMAIATSEGMISKVIQTQDLRTDGAKLAEALRRNAEVLFARADKEDEMAGEFYINFVDYQQSSARPELTEFPKFP